MKCCFGAAKTDCTDSSKTTFHVTDDDNNLKAKVRSSGMYLHEDGSAGSVQQVDF